MTLDEIKILIPGYYDEKYNDLGDYYKLTSHFGTELLAVHDEDYQGDSRLILEKDGKYGVLIFGWGSCSGCDALQACESYENLLELYNQLEHAVIWHDTAKECLIYFIEHDWQGDYCWHAKETKEFVEKSIILLANKIVECNWSED